MTSNKKVLLYGGSFNPIHIGHINAALHAYQALNVDEVYFIPRRLNYELKEMELINERLEMLENDLESYPFFKVCDLEIKDQTNSYVYTIDTVNKLLLDNKNTSFYFLIGVDQLLKLHTWKDIEKLAKLVQFVCYYRPQYQIDDINLKKYNVILIKGETIDASSTDVRNGNLNLVSKVNRQYIIDNYLYLETRIKKYYDDKRYIHVLSVAETAKKLANIYNVSEKICYVASLLHDLAKSLSKDVQKEMMDKHFKKYVNYHSYCYHAYLSSYLAKTELLVKDPTILHAISCHARPEKDMNIIDKIVYIADKIEPKRDFFNNVYELYQLAFKDIDLCFIKCMENQVKYLKDANKEIDSNTIELIEYYKNNDEVLHKILQVLDDNKGIDIYYLNSMNVNPLVNYIILVTANSSTHANALSRYVSKVLEENNIRIYHVEGNFKSNWVLIDSANYIVHIMTQETREKLDLEKLYNSEKIYKIV